MKCERPKDPKTQRPKDPKTQRPKDPKTHLISNMMKHIYYLTDEELLLRWPALRGGSIDDRLVQDEQRRYRDEADSIEADVLVLGPENGPRECTKRDRSPWRPAEFAEQLRAHLRVLCTKRKKPRRAVIEDSDSDEQAAPRSLLTGY